MRGDGVLVLPFLRHVAVFHQPRDGKKIVLIYMTDMDWIKLLQSRIAVYSFKPSSELNEDQKKSVASLPSIQGAVRELEETKKAIEVCTVA